MRAGLLSLLCPPLWAPLRPYGLRRPKRRKRGMTRIVTNAGWPRRLAGWVALGVALTAAAPGRAEPLVSRFGQPATPGITRGNKPWEGPPAGFAVAPDPRAPARP